MICIQVVGVEALPASLRAVGDINARFRGNFLAEDVVE